MRKLSELYQLVYNEAKAGDFSCGICSEITFCPDLSDGEQFNLDDHFQKGDHRFPKEKRGSGYWFTPIQREEYLKYLIELCKEQNI